jgi:hypothetical protein
MTELRDASSCEPSELLPQLGEMMEKRAEAFIKQRKIPLANHLSPIRMASHFADFARLIEQETARKLLFLPYTGQIGSEGVCAVCHHYCKSPEEMRHFERCKGSEFGLKEE